MNVLGYSERGVVNSLAHEIGHRRDGDALFRQLLSLASFPFTESRPCPGPVDLLVEPSFSDFGDADAVALIGDDAVGRCAVFVEAKVKPCQMAQWRISDEFDLFRIGLQRRMNSSNLFAQLYHKFRLVLALQNGGITALEQGVSFPSWSSKTVRKIGGNKVVRRAVGRVLPFIERAFFVALVPDSADRVRQFFDSTLRSCSFENLDPWDVSNFGYLTWGDVERYCERAGLARTVEVFEFNRGQVYGP